MNKNTDPHWLEWAKELQFIAQAGLTYSRDPFDIERFERIREISAEIMSHQSDLPIEKVKELFCNETGFQTPKDNFIRSCRNKHPVPLRLRLPKPEVSTQGNRSIHAGKRQCLRKETAVST